MGDATPLFWLAFAVLVYTALVGSMVAVVWALSAMAASGRLARTVKVVAVGAWLVAVLLAVTGGPEWFLVAITLGVLWSVPLVMRGARPDRRRQMAMGASAVVVILVVLSGIVWVVV